MIKEILLSLAVAAFSGVSSFVGSPKKQIQELPYMNLSLSLGLYANGNTRGNGEYAYYEDGPRDGESDSFEYEDNTGYYYVMFGNDGCEFEITYNSGTYSGYFYVDGSLFGGLNTVDSYTGFNDVLIEEGVYIQLSFEFPEPVSPTSYTLTATLGVAYDSYQLTKNFVNCQLSSSPILPDNYTSNSQLSYYVLMVSNAGGYGFTAESVTQTGDITIRNFNLFDQYNNSGYYASCSFNVDLPLNNCSLSVTAFLPQYTITSTLEHCTVSPAIPSSYTGTSFSGDYTFTAESDYGFNKNYTHWEVTNLFIDSVEFSSLLWGSFYSSVTLHLRASGGNSSISVTAIKYDEESYKLGYDEGRADGWQAGYNQGHADGEIAGNSYGVWNWLKQAALTTGEFLSIPLLPGFSIGGLLTALAGLVIIWFFIKGFLFKS